MTKNGLLRFFQPPDANASDEPAWRLWMARLVVLAVITVDVVFTPLVVFGTPTPGWTLLLNLLLLAAGVLTLISMRRGALVPAALWWLLAQWAYLLAGLLTQGGVRSMFISSFILLMLVAGLLLDPNRFIRFALFGLLTVLGVMLMELGGLLPVGDAAYSPTHFWLGILVNLSLAVVLLYLYGRTIRFNLERNRRELLERRAAESALRQSQERYRNFIEHSFEGVALIEFDEPIAQSLPVEAQANLMYTSGYVAECNDALAVMLGYARSVDLIGRRVTELGPEPGREWYLNWFREMIRGGYRTSDRESRSLTQTGEALILLTNAVGMIDNDCLFGLWITQRDITARRKAEIALHRRTEQLSIINRIGTAIATLKDLPGVLQEVLEQLRQALPLDAFYVALYNDSRDKVYFPLVYDAGREWSVPPAPLDPGGWLQQVFQSEHGLLLNRTLEEVERLESDNTANRIGDTSQISASLLACPLRLGDEMIGVVTVQSYQVNAYDDQHQELLALASVPVAISIHNARLYESLQRELAERQKVELALQELNTGLEQRVQERTAQLEKAVEELEAFSYSVSHDLRAPLRAIDGYSRFLVDDYASRLDAEGLMFLENVRKAAQRMGVLIDDLLDLSRVSRLELHFQPVQLSELVGDIIEVLQSREPHRQVQVEIQPGLTVIGDAHLLRLALENLLDNAWKFTSRTLKARIEFGVEQQKGRQVFFVRDNGAGFDMRYRAKLFKPFSRLHGVEEFDGTGIGLANVRRVIDRHGGDVWAESALLEGATFYFTIPEPGAIL